MFRERVVDMKCSLRIAAAAVTVAAAVSIGPLSMSGCTGDVSRDPGEEAVAADDSANSAVSQAETICGIEYSPCCYSILTGFTCNQGLYCRLTSVAPGGLGYYCMSTMF